MAFSKGQSGNPKGRKKGVPNKSTHEAKEMLELAAQGVGGLDALTKFGKKRPDIFWPLWAKLLPKNIEVRGEIDHTLFTADERRARLAQLLGMTEPNGTRVR